MAGVDYAELRPRLIVVSYRWRALEPILLDCITMSAPLTQVKPVCPRSRRRSQESEMIRRLATIDRDGLIPLFSASVDNAHPPDHRTTSVGQPCRHASFLLTLYMCINTIPIERR
jgi:hypothetical protein